MGIHRALAKSIPPWPGPFPSLGPFSQGTPASIRTAAPRLLPHPRSHHSPPLSIPTPPSPTRTVFWVHEPVVVLSHLAPQQEAGIGAGRLQRHVELPAHAPGKRRRGERKRLLVEVVCPPAAAPTHRGRYCAARMRRPQLPNTMVALPRSGPGSSCTRPPHHELASTTHTSCRLR